MPARVCPYCRELNGASEPRCHRCGRRLPGPLLEGTSRLAREVLGADAPITRLVLGLELLVFALLVAADRRFPIGFNDAFRGSTLLRLGALGGPLTAGEPYRLLSAVFVHMGVLHVGMNMWMFSDLGARLERELSGSRAALIFLVSGVLGFVVSGFWYSYTLGFSPLTAGASGGVFGQIGAEVGILRARRDPEWRRSLMRNVLYALLLSFALRGVNTAAHLGGFAAGIALGFLFEVERRRYRLELVWRALTGLTLVLVVVSVLLSTHSTAWQARRVQELVYE
ncbi:MAG TPA: rhomboid family intramembrane serine protease [Polyangiaceae bacterium]|jgi:membrane associated rhomboid family serine protease|nr:rhomboid family intramembrane serine protease [Polyangiaceae bacterium]